MNRKAAVGRAFDAAADRYDAHAGLQRDVARELGVRIGRMDLPANAAVLEIGCGTGALTRLLRQMKPHARLVATDLSWRMARACRDNVGVEVLAMDGEADCVRPHSFDLICASLAFQWFDNLPGALRRLRSALRPGGRIVFATLGPGTLATWNQALGRRQRSAYPDAADIMGAWPGKAVIETAEIRVRHATGLAFLQGLRAIGAQTPVEGQGPVSAGRLRAALRQFESAHATTAEYEILYVELS